MVVSKKDEPKVWIANWRYQNQKSAEIKYLGSVLTEDRKCNTEIQQHVGIEKDAFEKLSIVLRNRKILLDTKNSVKNLI